MPESDNLLHRRDAKKCKGNRIGNFVCNPVDGRWVRYNKMDNYEKKLYDKYKGKDYIEYKKRDCDKDDLELKLDKIKGMDADDYECNDITGKWNKKYDLNYIINPEIKNNKELDIPSNLYNYYKKYIILPELKKNPDYIVMYKDKISIKKEVLDTVVKEDWLKLKESNNAEYKKIKEEYEKLCAKRDELMKKKNIKPHIGVKIIRTGKHVNKTYNGWSLFLHRYKVKNMKKNIRAIDKSKIMSDIWHNKLTQKERDEWSTKAMELNNKLPVVQTKEELVTGNALIFSDDEKQKILKDSLSQSNTLSNTKFDESVKENEANEDDKLIEKLNKINKK